MADITELEFVGDWRVTVTSRDAGWAQRVHLTGLPAGDVALGGNPGASMDVYGDARTPWMLRIEHNDGSHGWQPSWLRATSSIAGARLSLVVESEDTTTAESDRDFNDLVIKLEKIGMASQPVPPFAVRPDTLQAMPEGVFEASLGRYFMAVRVTNIWTLAWPASTRVGLTGRCRTWLASAGVVVVDSWSVNEQATLGQAVAGGSVVVGTLQPWQSRRIYFKVDVSAAAVRKHQVELQVTTDQGAEDISLVNRAAKAPISVSRTTYDTVKKAFVSECDAGTLTAAIREIVVDLGTFKSAMQQARRLMRAIETGPGGSGMAPGGGTPRWCDRRAFEWVREQLRAFLDGKNVDLCAVWRVLSCCCTQGGARAPGDGDGDWTEGAGPGLTFFAWPTSVDYTIEYRPPFAGQYGPIPFDDPWWKLLLILLAIILSLCAAASSTADLANRSDDVVIGTLTRSVMNPQRTRPAAVPASTDPGSVDAAVVTLNGNRGLTGAVFSLLDAASGEATTTPIVSLGGHIDTPGTFLTNAQIDAIFQNLANNPADPAAQAAVRAYKSGARSGLSTSLLVSSVVPIAPRGPEEDGSTVYFLNQIDFTQDASGEALSCAGDSGSLWLQQGTNAVIGLNHAGSADESGAGATACRIQDVLDALGIRFA